jgi:hypothetical protein
LNGRLFLSVSHGNPHRAFSRSREAVFGDITPLRRQILKAKLLSHWPDLGCGLDCFKISAFHGDILFNYASKLR